jgi:hypothetical protein
MDMVGGTSHLPSHSPGRNEQLTREQRRSRRKRNVRARTVSVKRMTRYELEASRCRHAEVEMHKPATRGECSNTARPCPFVSCRHHLYLDVSPRTGSIKINFPDLEVWQLPVSCALDIAEAGGCTLEAVGDIMNLTRERVRQLEVRALARLEAVCDMAELREFVAGQMQAHDEG